MFIFVDVLGAGKEIGRSCVIVTWSKKEKHRNAYTDVNNSIPAPLPIGEGIFRVMFDCGYHLNNTEEPIPNFYKWLNVRETIDELVIGTFLSERINLILLTHYHLDHSGALPYLLSRLNTKIPVYATYPTIKLSVLLISDACKQPPVNYSNQELQVYASRISTLFNNSRTILREVSATPVEIHVECAGHTVGASVFSVEYQNLVIKYTGDINLNYGMITKPLSTISRLEYQQTDILICESTYGNLHKHSMRSSAKGIASAALETLSVTGSKVLIPSVSIGKLQEIIAIFAEFFSLHNINYPIYIAGYIAAQGQALFSLLQDNTIYKNSGRIDSRVSDARISFFKQLNIVQTTNLDSDFWLNSESCILIASPAIMNGGPSWRAFEEWCGSSKNMIIFTGACQRKSIANTILSGSKTVSSPINDKLITINCKKRYFPLPSHSGKYDLLNYIREINPRHLFLIHGEEEAMESLAHQTRNSLKIKTFIPTNHSSTSIRFSSNLEIGFLPKNYIQILNQSVSAYKFVRKLDNVFKIESTTGNSKKIISRKNIEGRLLSYAEKLTSPPMWNDIVEILDCLEKHINLNTEDGEICDSTTSRLKSDFKKKITQNFFNSLLESGLTLSNELLNHFNIKSSTKASSSKSKSIRLLMKENAYSRDIFVILQPILHNDWEKIQCSAAVSLEHKNLNGLFTDSLEFIDLVSADIFICIKTQIDNEAMKKLQEAENPCLRMSEFQNYLKHFCLLAVQFTSPILAETFLSKKVIFEPPVSDFLLELAELINLYRTNPEELVSQLKKNLKIDKHTRVPQSHTDKRNIHNIYEQNFHVLEGNKANLSIGDMLHTTNNIIIQKSAKRRQPTIKKSLTNANCKHFNDSLYHQESFKRQLTNAYLINHPKDKFRNYNNDNYEYMNKQNEHAVEGSMSSTFPHMPTTHYGETPQWNMLHQKYGSVYPNTIQYQQVPIFDNYNYIAAQNYYDSYNSHIDTAYPAHNSNQNHDVNNNFHTFPHQQYTNSARAVEQDNMMHYFPQECPEKQQVYESYFAGSSNFSQLPSCSSSPPVPAKYNNKKKKKIVMVTPSKIRNRFCLNKMDKK